MSRSSKEAIILVLDITGPASKHVCDSGNTFLDMSKKCIERIVERKVFSSASDEIGLVLLGTEETVNALQRSEHSSYKHISEGFCMANPSWNMLKIIQEIKGTKVDKCDWIDALVVAMDVLQTQTDGKKFTGKKIVLFVDPDKDASDDKLDTIINGIQCLEIELTVIGIDLFSEDEIKQEEMDHENNENGDAKKDIGDLSEKSRKERSIALLQHIVTECGGISCNFEDALSQLKTYQQKAVRPTPWNAFLEIGQDIKIPVAAYKKIAPVSLPTWQKTVRDVSKKVGETPIPDSQHVVDNVRLEQDRVYMRDDRTVVEMEDRIAGYYFGSSAVPFNEFDNEQMKYKSGEKCLNILGFARRADIQRRFFIGEGVYYLVPQKKFPDAQQALSALIQTLHDQHKVAIATKVYRKDSAPNLVALYPLFKKKFKCLMLVELPFSEDVNEFVFPRVVPEKDEPNGEELGAVDVLMDTMDLVNSSSSANDSEKSEALCLKDTVDPALMHQFRCIAHRALHPEEPLPAVFEDIQEMMTCPFQTRANYKLALENIKDKFRIIEQPEMSSIKKEEPNEKSKKKSTSENDQQPSTSRAMNVGDEDDIVKNALAEVGTVKPHEDFMALLAQGEQFKPVCEQMEKVILKMVLNSFGSESFNKALLALTTLRKSCVERNPVIYNTWLPDFKKTLSERDRLKFWELVVKDDLGLVTSEENGSSSVSPQEALALFKEPEEHQTMNEEQDFDADDLIGEM